MSDIMKIVKSPEKSGLLIKGNGQKIKNETKEQKEEFLSMLLGTLDASLFGNLLTGKGTFRAREGKAEFLRLAYPLTNLEIQKYYQNEPEFNGVSSKNNLPKIKDGAYVTHLDEYISIGTHRIALYVHNNNTTYFGSFRFEHIPKEIRSKTIITNVYRIQAYNSIIREYFCIGFIDFMLKGKILLGYPTLFSHNNYEKNDRIILKNFQ